MTDKQCECPSMLGDTCHMGEGCRAFEMVKRFSLQQAGAKDSGKKLAQQLERLSGIAPPGDECTDRYLNALAESVVRRGFSCVFDDLKRVTAERDAMAAKLAELEGQEPVAWIYDWQVPEGLIRDWSTNNAAEIPEGATNIRPLFARQVPAEPVNARLLEAMKRAKSALVSFKFIPGEANRWEESDEEDLAAIDGAIAAAEAQQERLLQDMHDAGREIDRVMAESAPKAVRLTDEEIKAATKANALNGLVLRTCRAIETAVLRKNGFPADGGDAT